MVFGVSFNALEVFSVTTVLSAIALYDARERRIPAYSLVLLPLLGIGFGLCLKVGLLQRFYGLLGGFIFTASFLVVATGIGRRLRLINREEFAMGWADPFLLGGIGSFVGVWNLPHIAFWASLQGLMAWMLIPSVRSSVPIGSFLALGAIEMILFSNWRPI